MLAISRCMLNYLGKEIPLKRYVQKDRINFLGMLTIVTISTSTSTSNSITEKYMCLDFQSVVCNKNTKCK